MKSWQWNAGCRAGFGQETFSREYFDLYPSYRNGYWWARTKLTARKARDSKQLELFKEV